MKRKIRNERLSFGILYSLVSVIMGASHVEASTPQQQCEQFCLGICASLPPPPLPPSAQIWTDMREGMDYLIHSLPNDIPAQQDMNTFYNAVNWRNPQSFYSSVVGSYPAYLSALCGTTPGQTNCATVCAPSNVGQKTAPQVKAPAPKAAPAKK